MRAPADQVERRLPALRTRLDPILVVCWLSGFAPILDANIVNLALPRIGMAFDTSASAVVGGALTILD